MNIARNIREAVERALGQKSAFVAIMPVSETFQGGIVWQGMVSTFSASDGRICYGWAIPGEKEPLFVTILAASDIKTPQDAVGFWLLSRRHTEQWF